ncbi:MAG: hypothetical protein HYU64_20155 [Armatimonadetes bacterium]|nr:hypothetical protein [Armatimonadota bacterium]
MSSSKIECKGALVKWKSRGGIIRWICNVCGKAYDEASQGQSCQNEFTGRNGSSAAEEFANAKEEYREKLRDLEALWVKVD